MAHKRCMAFCWKRREYCDLLELNVCIIIHKFHKCYGFIGVCRDLVRYTFKGLHLRASLSHKLKELVRMLSILFTNWINNFQSMCVCVSAFLRIQLISWLVNWRMFVRLPQNFLPFSIHWNLSIIFGINRIPFEL